MGKGGEKVSGYNTRLRRVPHEKPPFTLGDIKKAIPSHCFNRSLILSFSWLIFDLSAWFITYHIATTYIPLLPNSLAWLAWTTYACIQGSFVTALWIIGHECNHNAFSDYYWLNDTVGFILHSLVLHPYFSFKISHRLHHANTSSLQRDENHVPRFKQTLRMYNFKSPMARMLGAPLYLALGWPLYMTINMAGRTYDGFASHFYPYSPIFNKRERIQVVVSDIGVLATCYGLYYIATVKGLSWLLLVYGAPLFVYGGHFVLISLLHHTHPSLPRYDPSEWDWMRGTLATVDRDYGIFNKLFHNVTNTHVLHHFFTTIPHYHVVEATEAIKPILGDYYLYDPTPVYKAFWREVKECLYVEEDEGGNASKGVYWFKNTT